MTKSMTYSLSFGIEVDSLRLLWPNFPDFPVDARYVVTYAAWDSDGEPIPTSDIRASFSQALGMPFHYATVSPVGRSTPPATLQGRRATRVDIAIRTWGRNSPTSIPGGIGPLVAQGTRSTAPLRSVAIIQEGVPA